MVLAKAILPRGPRGPCEVKPVVAPVPRCTLPKSGASESTWRRVHVRRDVVAQGSGAYRRPPRAKFGEVVESQLDDLSQVVHSFLSPLCAKPGCDGMAHGNHHGPHGKPPVQFLLRPPWEGGQKKACFCCHREAMALCLTPPQVSSKA